MLNRDETDQEIDASKSGLARELARMGLPLSTYTQWYWKVNLHNLLHFLQLRADAHAQWEIRTYADVLLDVVEKWVPLTHRAFMNYRVGGAPLTEEGLDIVRRMLKGETVDPATLEMSHREWRELKALLAID